MSNVCPCGANNRTSVFAKQTGGARCAPPSVDPSAASRQIPSMFRSQRENSSPAVHLPPRSYPQNSQPLPNPTSEGAGLLTFIPYYNRTVRKMSVGQSNGHSETVFKNLSKNCRDLLRSQKNRSNFAAQKRNICVIF